MDQQQEQFNAMIKERFALLPKVVQDAITSAEVEKHLRELATIHKLHLDQWGILENEVQLTLLGVKEAEDLEQNIRREMGVPQDIARLLANDITHTIFEPIREELERQLEHPEAKEVTVNTMDAARSEILQATDEAVFSRPAVRSSPVLPATPPQGTTAGTVERVPQQGTYAPRVQSYERKDIKGDPYREQI